MEGITGTGKRLGWYSFLAGNTSWKNHLNNDGSPLCERTLQNDDRRKMVVWWKRQQYHVRTRERTMPVYIRCQNCGVQFDRTQKFSDEPLRWCRNAARSLRKVYARRIIFKGSGFTPLITVLRRPAAPKKEHKSTTTRKHRFGGKRHSWSIDRQQNQQHASGSEADLGSKGEPGPAGFSLVLIPAPPPGASIDTLLSGYVGAVTTGGMMAKSR